MIKQCVLDYSNTILPYASLERGQAPLLSVSEEPCLFFVLVLTTSLPQKVSVLCPPPSPPPPGVTRSWISRIILSLCFLAWCLQMAVFTYLPEQSGCTRVPSLQTPQDFPWGQSVARLRMLSLQERRRKQKFLLPSSQTTAYFSFCGLAFSREAHSLSLVHQKENS